MRHARDRGITTVAKTLLILLNVGLFALVWLNYYNARAFRSHRLEGAWVSIAIYTVIYFALCKLYRGYAIASSPIEETVLSQFISFGIADLVFYIAVTLLQRHYVDIAPGLVAVAWQLFGSTLIVWLSKRYMLTHIRPAPTLLVYGGGTDRQKAEQFTARLCKKYGHLFAVSLILPEGDEQCVREGIDRCENVILTGVEPNLRTQYMELCLEKHKVFYFVPELADILCRSCSVKNFLDTPMMRYNYNYNRQPMYTVKRLLDIVFSLFFLVILSPLLIIAAIAIKIEDGGPVLYRQKRVTLDGTTFNICKFRSMVVDAENMGAMPATQNDPRITRVGAILRKTRFDEIPQLLNILRGHMSFVGPRPERTLHVALYERELPEFRYRLRVKGGLTGYAQVYGKYNTSPEDKLKLDMLYIENQSLLLDFKLVLLTIKTVFKPEATEGFDEDTSRAIHAQDQTIHQQSQNVE